MEQLVKAKHLIELVVGQKGGVVGQTSRSQGGAQSPPLEVIEVIHAATIGVSAIPYFHPRSKSQGEQPGTMWK